MKQKIVNELTRYVRESGKNWLEATNNPIYDEPVIQFASANDPLFLEYKTLIGPDHLTPREAFEQVYGADSYRGGTVVSVVLPIHAAIRKSNAKQKHRASKEWALLRTFGDEHFIKGFLRYTVEYLKSQGYRTVAPADAESFRIYRTESGPASTWSERHIAYAAGLGSFGINDGFITEKGIAVRLLSVVTELQLPPDSRKASSHVENCLLCSKGTCGACTARCPVQAISKQGHDKLKCLSFVYGEESRQLAVSYGGDAKFGSGCGLCQTRVPCEFRNPTHITG